MPTLVPHRRGAIAAYKRHLNEVHAMSGRHKNFRYQQVSRPYGDYVYSQDREMFNIQFNEEMTGKHSTGFDRAKWLPDQGSGAE